MSPQEGHPDEPAPQEGHLNQHRPQEGRLVQHGSKKAHLNQFPFVGSCDLESMSPLGFHMRLWAAVLHSKPFQLWLVPGGSCINTRLQCPAPHTLIKATSNRHHSTKPQSADLLPPSKFSHTKAKSKQKTSCFTFQVLIHFYP